MKKNNIFLKEVIRNPHGCLEQNISNFCSLKNYNTQSMKPVPDWKVK